MKKSLKTTENDNTVPKTRNDQKISEVEKQWSELKNTVTAAAENIIGRKRGRKREQWISDHSWELIDQRKEAKRTMLHCQNETTRSEYRQIDKQVKKQTKRDKQNWLDEKIKQAQQAAERNDTRTTYRIIKELTNDSKKQNLPIKSKDGKALSTEKEVAERWIEHFNSVLNQPEPSTLLEINEEIPEIQDIETGRIERCEIEAAIKKLKNNKSPGADGIHPEMIKYGGECLIETIQNLCNIIWVKEKVPDEWKIGTIVPLPKKGDLSNCSNWRGITLLSVPGKILSIVILNRLKNAVDKLVREEQCGFRPGRSCTDAIFTLRNIIEKTTEHNIPLYFHFVDFQKAFDSLHRETMWKVLKSYGIPRKIINIIRAIYCDTKCNIRLETNTTDAFEINTGVRQGCILSPFLFTLVINEILQRQDGKGYGIDISGKRLFDMDFADDIALISSSNAQLQKCSDELRQNSEKVGLRFNIKKCETMGTLGNIGNIEIGNEIVKDVENFTYLGSIISNNGQASNEIKSRLGKAGAAFGKMHKIWSSKQINLKTKLNIYHATITSILLYGSETWKIYATERKKLNSFHLRCIRKMLGIRWQDKVRNEEVLRRTGERNMMDIITERRLRWFGHVERMKEERIARKTMHWKPTGKRNRGRQKLTWREQVCQDLKKASLTWEEALDTTRDRREWQFVTALCASSTGWTKV